MYPDYHPDFLPKLADLHRSYVCGTRGMPAFPVEHWEALFARGEIDPRKDVFLALRDDAENGTDLSGFAWLHVRLPERRAFLRGPFLSPSDPDCPAILQDFYTRAVARASESDVDFIEGRSLYKPWEEGLQRAGFEGMGLYERWRCFPLKGDISLPDLPDKCDIRGWRGVTDIPILMELFTEAFSDHWDYAPPRRESWEEIVRGRHFEPGLVVILTVKGRPVGYVFGQTIPDPSTISLQAAYLVSIALGKACRGRGLGEILLSRWMRAVYDSGMRAVELDVDSDNPSARRLYEKYGFKCMRAERIWRRYLAG